MAQVTGTGTIWNLPNYAGDLFTADPTQTPFLSMIGGLTGGKQTDNFEFTTGQLYDFPQAAQPGISETASVTAPTPSEIARTQEKNVVQIHQEAIELTYVKKSNMGRLSGLNTAGQTANPADEEAWQIQQKLVKIARDIEFSFLQGTYAIATAANVANQTRGMIELTKSAAGTSVDASGATLTKAMLDTIYKDMADAGAAFGNMVLFTGSKYKQIITGIYGSQFGANQPPSRNVGGLNITDVETDFFRLGIVCDPFMPQDTILIADVNACAPVFQPVPGKGNFFVEDLSKTGASDKKQIFGQVGLDHGPAFLHGSIYGLA